METPSTGRPLLVIGHPGHELRVFGWVAKVKPLVCILTDGSGSDGLPRIEQTLKILEALGARIGPICGELSDQKIYSHMLAGNHAPFASLCRRLAELIKDESIDVVASDGIEGYNPTHDLCETLTRTATHLAMEQTGRSTLHYTFPLMGDPRLPVVPRQTETYEIDLGPELFQQKLATAQEYARLAGPTLQQEVEYTLKTFGEAAFAREYLFRMESPGLGADERFKAEKPYYETYGEKQVAAGRYAFVLRFQQHVLPVINHLGALEL